MHPVPTDEQITAILKRHGFPGGTVEASPHEGSVNHIRMVGDLCVRVLKEEDYASDVCTEVVAVPAVREVGVTTPELLAFDDARDIVPGLVTVYRRLPGIPLGECASIDDLEGVVRAIAQEIARWQIGLSHVDDTNGWLDKPRHDDLGRAYERNAERLSRKEREWTEAAIGRLGKAKQPESRFVRWDLHRHNILVHEDRFVAILDWGDAGWGDPSINYHCLPADWLPLLLEPLGEVDHDFIGRCLYGALGYALNDVHRPTRGPGPHSNMGHDRWESLQRLARANIPVGWRDWLGDGPP